MNAGANAGQEASPENASTWQSTPGALLNSAPPVQAVAHWQRRDDGWVPGRSAEARTAAHPDDSAHHPALQYARHIARVGLLAAALGIGAAMARTPDIAWAEPAATESSTSESGQTTSSDPQSGPSNQRGTTASSPTSGTTSAPTGSPSTSVSSSGESQTSVSVSAPGSSSPSVVVRSSGGARTPRPGGIAGRQPATGPGRAPAQTPDESSALAAAPEQPGQLAASEQAPAAPARPHRHGSSQPAGPASTPAAVGTVGPAAPSGGTALHQPSGAVSGKPLADSAAALAHTADSTLNRHTVESVGPTAAFTPHLTAAPPAGPITTVVSSLLAAVGITSSSGVSTGDVPVAPMPLVLGALQLIRREIAHTFLTEASGVAPSTVAPRSLVTSAAAATTMQPNTGASLVSPGVPQPGDVVTTVYGDVGEWMLKANGEISNWGGQTHDGKALLEPINVIVIDPTSTTREESIKKVNRQ